MSRGKKPAWGAGRRSKYAAVRTEVNGRVFASKKEAKRYSELLLLERAGEITNLTCQVEYPLCVHGHPICKYVADFVYRDKNGCEVTEDVKGFRTREYKLKAKLVRAIYGFTIKEL